MNPQLIEEIAALVLQLGPLAVDLIVKLETTMNLGPDDKANIAKAITASDEADNDTIARVNAWLAANPAK